MDGPTLQARASARALLLPDAELTHPFGDDWDVFKVGGKVFMLLSQVAGEPAVILKAHPLDSEALREQYPQITPGYHMNKRHWITLNPAGEDADGPVVDADLVDELVTESYLLVVRKLPNHARPVLSDELVHWNDPAPGV